MTTLLFMQKMQPTPLMGAFVSYLHAVHGINHFFVLAPNLTIYSKLITDFTPTRRNMSLPGSPNLRRNHRRSLPATIMNPEWRLD